MNKQEVKLVQDLVRFCKDVGIQNFHFGTLEFSFRAEEEIENAASGFNPQDVLFAASEGIKRKVENG